MITIHNNNVKNVTNEICIYAQAEFHWGQWCSCHWPWHGNHRTELSHSLQQDCDPSHVTQSQHTHYNTLLYTVSGKKRPP